MIPRSLCQNALACALLLWLPLTGLSAEPARDLRTIMLEGDLTLRLRSITPHRTTPYLYLEQGLQTIEAIGKQQVLMSRRNGTLGGQPPVQYSLIAFTDKAASSCASIHGQVLIGSQAWEYQTITKRDNWQESIPLVIEALSQLAIRSTSQPGDSHKEISP
jgi:hypothetical protein